MGRLTCEHCGHGFSSQRSRCPHCERPAASYPNVFDATRPEELQALAARYHDAKEEARSRGVEDEVLDLEAELGDSQAVRTVRIHELQRLLASERQTAARYYQLFRAGLVLPEDDTEGVDWDRLRRVAESVAFSTYAAELQFAALSIDDAFPAAYGHAALFLRDDLIAHRATVFEDNIVLWQREQGLDWTIPPGHRAAWGDRAALGVAKLAESVKAESDPRALVLRAGETTADDSMIEVHVFGSFTVHALDYVLVEERWLSPGLRDELDAAAETCGFSWSGVS